MRHTDTLLWLKQKNNFLPKATKKNKKWCRLYYAFKKSTKQNNCFPLSISILQLRKFISEEENISSFIYVVTLTPGLSLKKMIIIFTFQLLPLHSTWVFLSRLVRNDTLRVLSLHRRSSCTSASLPHQGILLWGDIVLNCGKIQ